VTKGAAAARNAAVNEATRQADFLVSGHLAGTDDGSGGRTAAARARRELAVQIVQFRIELAAGIDPLASVVGLRRWGATWDLIARAAGISRQAAHERWGRLVVQVLDRYRTGEFGADQPD
jgi:hypothetical protein